MKRQNPSYLFALLIIVVSLVNRMTDRPLIRPIRSEAVRTAPAELSLTATPTNIPTPTETLTPSPIPTGNITATRAILEISQEDRHRLAWLGYVEARGFSGDIQRYAVLSIISTVTTRMATGILSDGTVKGTLEWNCKAGDQECQFPAWVASLSCDGILDSACPLFGQDTVIDIEWIVDLYFDQGERGPCDGYLYYWLLEVADCTIREGGQYLNFYGKP